MHAKKWSKMAMHAKKCDKCVKNSKVYIYLMIGIINNTNNKKNLESKIFGTLYTNFGVQRHFLENLRKKRRN